MTKILSIQPTPIIVNDTFPQHLFEYQPWVHCLVTGSTCDLTLKNESKYISSNYTINWGDGTQFNSTTMPDTIHHSYSQFAEYTVIVSTPNGCISNNFFCGEYPAVGIACPKNRLACTGDMLSFPVDTQLTSENASGTWYTVDFGDGMFLLLYLQNAASCFESCL